MGIGGAAFVDDVKPYELMKIRLLNGGHSALAYISLLAGYTFVDDAMNDKRIHNFTESYMNELKKTLEPIDGVDFDEYIRILLKRFANPAVRDRLLRLAEDGSTKILNSMITPLLTLLERGEGVPGLTIALATWISYIKQASLNRNFELKDPIAEKLMEKAARSSVSLEDFLSIREVFPKKIFQYPGFIKGLGNVLDRISGKGIQDLLEDY